MGQLIGDVVNSLDNDVLLDRAHVEVREMLAIHPLYGELTR